MYFYGKDDSFSSNTNGQAFFNGGSCYTREGLPGRCQALATCYYQYDNLVQIGENQCNLDQSSFGVCCPTNDYRLTHNGLLQIAKSFVVLNFCY